MSAFFLTRLARRDPRAALTAGTLLLVTPALQLFCGYVESYAPLAGACLVFFAAGFDRVTGGGKAALFVALAAQVVALAAHPFGVALAPATLLLLTWRPGASAPVLERRPILLAAGGLLGLTALLWIVFTLKPELHAPGQALRYLAPQEFVTFLVQLITQLLSPRPWATQYTILSTVHAADVWNTVWLAGAPGLVWVAALLVSAAGRRTLRSGPALLALAALAPALLFRLLLRTPLGAARDWDLFAIAGLVLGALAAATVLSGAGRRLVGPAVAAGLFFTIPWVGIQMSDSRSAARHFEALEADPMPEPFVASGYHGVMGDRFGDLRRFDLAELAYGRSLQAYPRYDYAWRLGVVEMGLQKYDRAVRALAKAAELRPDDREALTELGNACTGAGQTARADSILARVVALYPTKCGEALVYRARLHFHMGDDAGGRHWLAEAKRVLPPNDLAWRDVTTLEEEVRRVAAGGGVPTPPAVAPGDTPPTRR